MDEKPSWTATSADAVSRVNLLRTLFTEIGEEGLLKILNEFYQRMARDTFVGFFFTGKDLSHIARQQASFLLKAMGMKDEYNGKPPARAHDSIPKIRTGHFNRRLILLRETLQANGVQEPQIEAWIHFEDAFRGAILGKPATTPT